MFEILVSFGGKPSTTFAQEITKHLLKDEIKHYFFNDGNSQVCTYTWNPFTFKPDDLLLGTGEQEELIDLQCDEGVRRSLKILHWPTCG